MTVAKKFENNLHRLEILGGWNYAEHKLRFKDLEVCTDCRAHFRTMINNALCEAERKVLAEFLKEVKEGIYECLRLIISKFLSSSSLNVKLRGISCCSCGCVCSRYD